MKMDLMIVIDGSSSMSGSDFENIKQFLIMVVSRFEIGLEDMTVAALTYNRCILRLLISVVFYNWCSTK